MRSELATDLLKFWYDALRSPYGIAIRVSHPDLTVVKLYTARKGSFDPALAALSICRPSNPTELWLVHKKALRNAP